MVPEAVDLIDGHIFAYFKFLGCDTGSEELNRNAYFLFYFSASVCVAFSKISSSLEEINATLVQESV